MLKTFALRGREVPLTIYGPRGLQSLMSDLRRVYGKLTYDVRLEELAPSQAVPFDGFRIGAYGAVHRLEALGYALFEEERPGRFDPARARELGIQEGPEFGRLQRGEVVEAGGRRVEPGDVMGEPAARPHPRVHRRHRALRGDGRGGAGSRPAGPRQHVRGGGGRARGPDRPLDRARRRPRWRARRVCRCSRSRISPRGTSLR